MILEHTLPFNFIPRKENTGRERLYFPFPNFVYTGKETWKCQHWRALIGIIIFNFSKTLRKMVTVILVESQDPSKATLLFKLSSKSRSRWMSVKCDVIKIELCYLRNWSPFALINVSVYVSL